MQKNRFPEGNSNSNCEIKEQLHPTAYGYIWTRFWGSQHVTLHVMHFPFVLTWELCIQGADPPSEFIRRNNNQCTSLGCWASRSILHLSVCWNSGRHKCSLLWLKTAIFSLFYWNEIEKDSFWGLHHSSPLRPSCCTVSTGSWGGGGGGAGISWR